MACVRGGVSYKRHHWITLGENVKGCAKCGGLSVPEGDRDAIIKATAERIAAELHKRETT